jgi:poly(3-hydroxybutyrate) depolymerase
MDHLVHVPRKYNSGKAAAVIMLHGLGGNARNSLAQGKWFELHFRRASSARTLSSVS